MKSHEVESLKAEESEGGVASSDDDGVFVDRSDSMDEELQGLLVSHKCKFVSH